MSPSADHVSLQAAAEQLRALPGRRRARTRAASRVGRWAVITALLLGTAGGAAVIAGAGETASPRAVSPPASTTTVTTVAPVRYAEGVVETDDGRWAMGASGDVIALGDWDCDGIATPALLRPSTGAVYAFNEWAPPERDVVAEPLGTASSASELVADDVDGDGCDDVVVRTADGGEHVFRPADRL